MYVQIPDANKLKSNKNKLQKLRVEKVKEEQLLRKSKIIIHDAQKKDATVFIEQNLIEETTSSEIADEIKPLKVKKEIKEENILERPLSEETIITSRIKQGIIKEQKEISKMKQEKISEVKERRIPEEINDVKTVAVKEILIQMVKQEKSDSTYKKLLKNCWVKGKQKQRATKQKKIRKKDEQHSKKCTQYFPISFPICYGRIPALDNDIDFRFPNNVFFRAVRF